MVNYGLFLHKSGYEWESLTQKVIDRHLAKKRKPTQFNINLFKRHILYLK